jgi:hypothetical protein
MHEPPLPVPHQPQLEFDDAHDVHDEYELQGMLVGHDDVTSAQ